MDNIYKDMYSNTFSQIVHIFSSIPLLSILILWIYGLSDPVIIIFAVAIILLSDSYSDSIFYDIEMTKAIKGNLIRIILSASFIVTIATIILLIILFSYLEIFILNVIAVIMLSIVVFASSFFNKKFIFSLTGNYLTYNNYYKPFYVKFLLTFFWLCLFLSEDTIMKTISLLLIITMNVSEYNKRVNFVIQRKRYI